jgi:patatin-like phospholipase/acyl hydrolase
MVYRILSLDGGGIRGVITTRLVSEIEKRTGRRICDLFDLVVGTSTGGMLGTALVAPQHRAEPVLDLGGNSAFQEGPYSGAFLQDLYSNHGRDIFPKSVWRTIKSLNGVAGVKYSADGFEAIAQHMFGDQRLRDTVQDLVATSFDTQGMVPYLFKTTRARQHSEQRDHYLRDVVRGTSAAPSFYPPMLLIESPKKGGGAPKSMTLVDGGVFANNPSMVALTEAMSNGQSRENVVLCSIGTGAHDDRGYQYDKIKGWGEVHWLLPLMHIAADGQSAAAEYQVKQMLQHEIAKPLRRHFRFNTRIVHGSTSMDDVSKANVDGLLQDAETILQTQAEDFEAMLAWVQQPLNQQQTDSGSSGK